MQWKLDCQCPKTWHTYGIWNGARTEVNKVEMHNKYNRKDKMNILRCVRANYIYIYIYMTEKDQHFLT